MLAEAIQRIRSLSPDAAERADRLEGYLKQIEGQSGGGWSAVRGMGTDCSHIFLGRQGESLIVATDGHLYRGAIGKGIDVTATGLQPDYSALTPLD